MIFFSVQIVVLKIGLLLRQLYLLLTFVMCRSVWISKEIFSWGSFDHNEEKAEANAEKY